MRASCEYDNSLLFGGVDSREELDAGYEDFQKLGIIKKDANDDTKWDRIADYKDFGDYAKDSAVFSNVTSPIWDMCTWAGTGLQSARQRLQRHRWTASGQDF